MRTTVMDGVGCDLPANLDLERRERYPAQKRTLRKVNGCLAEGRKRFLERTATRV
jgi:hypothetical protein